MNCASKLALVQGPFPRLWEEHTLFASATYCPITSCSTLGLKFSAMSVLCNIIVFNNFSNELSRDHARYFKSYVYLNYLVSSGIES